MSMPVRQILPSPGKLVSNGRFNLGTFNQAFTEINPLDAKIGSLFPYSRSFKNFRLKEWQHFALVNEDYYISLALFNAKTLALAQVCLYDRKSGSIHFYEKKKFPGNAISFNGFGYSGVTKALVDSGLTRQLLFAISTVKKLRCYINDDGC